MFVSPVSYVIIKTCPCSIENNYGCKNENFHWKILIFFSVFLLKKIDCGYTLASTLYPLSVFWSKNMKKVYPGILLFHYIKWGLVGYSLHGDVFLMDS